MFPLLVGYLFQDVSCGPVFYPLFFMVGLLWAMVVRAEPSLIHTLPGACGLSSLLYELWTLPGQYTQSLVGAHTPWRGGWPGGEETGAVAAGEFPKVLPRVFFFLEKSSCSILWLPPYKEGPVLSHSPLL